MNTQIPDNFINISHYVSRCDYIFTQPFVEIPYENNRLSDITDNSTECYVTIWVKRIRN